MERGLWALVNLGRVEWRPSEGVKRPFGRGASTVVFVALTEPISTPNMESVVNLDDDFAAFVPCSPR